VGLGLEGQILVDMRGTPMGYLENGLQMKKDEILRPLGDLGDQVPKDISRTEALWIITLLVEDRLRQMGVDERKVKEYGTHFLRKVWTRGEITADEIHVEAVARFGNRYGWSGFFRRVLLGIYWIKMVEYGEEWDRKRSLNLIKGGRAKLLVRFGDRF
ncbi:hypothetical protein HYS10_01230, partial [Candidatus Collierbacteria bacterium]|nr:hypothetical protein [Candidatus Collierbacteria bacterium]